MSRRILDETTKSTFASDDYLYMDGQTDGSSKITPDNLVRNTTVAQQLAQHIADAEDDVEQITSDIETIQGDINDVKSDLGDLDDLETEDKSSLVNAINEAKASGGSGVPTTVRSAMLALFEAAAYAETGLTDEIAVIESWAEEVTDITLNNSTISISGSGTSQLTATTTPSGGTVSWSSSNASVATVSNAGLVTGVSNGTATITASSGDVSATCVVTVSGFAELVSISAVYSGGTVYDTASLDDLKSDLVVTGTYDNQTTATITTYTLSGTLTEGTSTITVAYGGKTTTFNVTVKTIILVSGNYYECSLALESSSPYWLRYYTNNINRISLASDSGTNIIPKGTGTTEYTMYPILVPSDAQKFSFSFSDDSIAVIAYFVQWNGSKYIRATDSAPSYIYGSGEFEVPSHEGDLYVGICFRNTANDQSIKNADRTNWILEWQDGTV